MSFIFTTFVKVKNKLNKPSVTRPSKIKLLAGIVLLKKGVPLALIKIKIMVGVYYITNTINNKIYIGSSNNIEKRHSTHFSNLRYGKHSNKYLQAAVTKYGIDNFMLKAVELCEVDELLIVEQEHIDSYDKSQLYNLTYVTSAGGYDILSIPVYILDLKGNITMSQPSIQAAARHLNTFIDSTHTLNTGAILKKEYRLVSEKYYNNSIDVIKSWPQYSNIKSRLSLQRRQAFHKNREIIVTCNDIDTEYKTNNEAAVALGITGERVRQLLNKSSKKYSIRFKHN